MTLYTNVSRLVRRFAGREDGAVAIIVALMLPITFGVLALVEASRVYSVKNQLQITADAAAVASVREVSGGLAPVQEKAIDFAHRNMPISEQYGDILLREDVRLGLWDSKGRTLIAGDPNAVSVTTRTEMPLLFISVLRTVHDAFSDTSTSFSPVAEAIALYRLDKCYLNGFVAGKKINMNSSNSFFSNFCMYGRQGVKMNSSNTFGAGTEVSMVDLNDLEAKLDHNPGLEEALVQKDISAPVEGRAKTLIDDLRDGNGPMGWPLGPYDTLPPYNELESGRLYHITGAVDIKLNGGLFENIGIISDESITIRSNSNLRNVTLASRKAVNIKSKVEIGDEDFCESGKGASLIISTAGVTGEEVETGSNIALRGVQMVADGNVVMNSNLKIIAASVQATGNIEFNSQFEVAGCPDGTHANATGDGTMVSVLVD